MRDLTELFEKFRINPHNLEVYELAFTHPSFNADNNTHHHDYERLEFLGDSVLGLVIADLSFKERKDLNQGELSKLKSSLVQSKTLGHEAKKLGFLDFVRMGHSFVISDRNEISLLEDVFEAFIGAMYLDQGFNFAYKFVKNIFINDVRSSKVEQTIDFKSKLQEAMQSEKRKSVTYTLLKAEGPAHMRTFEVACYFEDQLLGKGKGKSKKEAEQNAAKEALRKAKL